MRQITFYKAPLFEIFGTFNEKLLLNIFVDLKKTIMGWKFLDLSIKFFY
ncbi:MAG: hypothetical protein HeimC3_53590 [Candidatus Heimdallarchaeota archaeon LC_3]|nr:MAG: hypothetical protein HeimC3_53590 [Candidatus Heimdallarchaeota archaeon LC_3]